MTIGDKIKAALHLDKDKSSTGTGSGSVGQTSEHYTPKGTEAGETGAQHYQPMTSGVTDGQSGASGAGGKVASGTGHASGTSSRAQEAASHPSGNVSSTAGHGATSGTTSAGGASSGVSGGDGVTASGGGDGSHFKDGYTSGGGDGSHFKDGYKAGEPGYSSEYKSGDNLYRDSRIGGDGSGYKEEFTASADNKEWAQARELTLAAEREAASAQVAGNKANKELLAAEKAEKALRDAQIKHREALQEAEAQRKNIAEANLKEQDLADANELYNARQQQARQAEEAMKQREAELGDRQKALQAHGQKVDQFGQNLPHLEDELAARQRDRAAAEDNAKQLKAAAVEFESNRSNLLAELERLQAEQEQAEALAAQRQQEYMDARNAAQNKAGLVDELKNKLRGLDEELMGRRNRAQEAEQELPQYKEAELRAQAELEDSQSEWYRLKELEDEYGRNYTLAHNNFKDAQGKYGPASKEMQASQSLLKAREDDLAGARSRASKAEGKYRELLNLADRHKKYGDSAAEAAQTHGQKYEALKREAALHGDKHVEYWNAARQHGDTGSNVATDTIHKLEEKLHNLTHSEP